MGDTKDALSLKSAGTPPLSPPPSSITMDSSLPAKSCLFFTHFLLLLTTTSVAAANDPGRPSPRPRLPSKEKVTRLRFYWHDLQSGKHPTSVTIVQSPSALNSSTGFGLVQMMDNLFDKGPQMTSKQVGRCQGIYALDGQQGLAVLMAMSVVFTDGRYNGSTLSIMGQNSVLDKVREIPVVGGTGAFPMARGYAIVRTLWLDSKTHDATGQYDVVVVHQ